MNNAYKYLPKSLVDHAEYDTKNMVNGVIKMSSLNDDSVKTCDLMFALVNLAGGITNKFPSDVDGDESLSSSYEWFDPYKITNIDELPWYWQYITLHQYDECWKCGYRYVHIPKPLLARFPRTPVRGIFSVIEWRCTPFNLRAENLIHLGNPFCEMDKHINPSTAKAFYSQE